MRCWRYWLPPLPFPQSKQEFGGVFGLHRLIPFAGNFGPLLSRRCVVKFSGKGFPCRRKTSICAFGVVILSVRMIGSTVILLHNLCAPDPEVLRGLSPPGPPSEGAQ